MINPYVYPDGKSKEYVYPTKYAGVEQLSATTISSGIAEESIPLSIVSVSHSDEEFLMLYNMPMYDRDWFFKNVGNYLKGILYILNQESETLIDRTECRKIVEYLREKQGILTTNGTAVSVVHIEGKEIIEE